MPDSLITTVKDFALLGVVISPEGHNKLLYGTSSFYDFWFCKKMPESN